VSCYDPRGRATLAQLVERLIRNQQVAGSTPAGGSNISKIFLFRIGWVDGQADSHWVQNGVHLSGSILPHFVHEMGISINHRRLIPSKHRLNPAIEWCSNASRENEIVYFYHSVFTMHLGC
jgi:hypothetical protein